MRIVFYQEIIKVREGISVVPLTKVIPFKLFVDVVPSSSEDDTRAMRGQPKRFLETTGEEMVGMACYMF